MERRANKSSRRPLHDGVFRKLFGQNTLLDRGFAGLASPHHSIGMFCPPTTIAQINFVACLESPYQTDKIVSGALTYDFFRFVRSGLNEVIKATPLFVRGAEFRDSRLEMEPVSFGIFAVER
jgi:hypothetical protein